MQKKVDWDTKLLVVGVRAEHLVSKGYGKKSTKEVDAESKGVRIVHVDSLDMMIEYLL